MKGGSWSEALANAEWVDVETFPGRLLLLGRARAGVAQESVLLYEAMGEVHDLAAEAAVKGDHMEPPRYYAFLRDLILDGIRNPWFCLGALGWGSFKLPQGGPWREEQVEFTAAVFSRILEYWELFSSWESRFSCYGSPGDTSGRWPHWGWNLVVDSYVLGATDKDIERVKAMTPEAAGQWFRRLVQDVRDKGIGGRWLK
jgi:hypothetical protein